MPSNELMKLLPKAGGSPRDRQVHQRPLVRNSTKCRISTREVTGVSQNKPKTFDLLIK